MTLNVEIVTVYFARITDERGRLLYVGAEQRSKKDARKMAATAVKKIKAWENKP